jgi:AcrR family transcriptional regulator
MARDSQRKAGRPRNPVSREDLLSAARAAFAESGFSGASMNGIAERAGIRKASLFHHFDSKESLYLEMLSSITADLSQLVINADLAVGDFETRLDQLSALVTGYLGQHPHVARLAMRELVDAGPFAGGTGRAQVELALKVVVAFLAGGMKQEIIPKQDARQLAISITGIHLFHFAASEFNGTLFDSSLFSEESVKERTLAVTQQVRRICGLS